MGAGKSRVGAALAARLDQKFVDLDALIETREGKSIPELFASGEGVFRDAEHEALRSLIDAPDSVIACGGGIVVRGRGLPGCNLIAGEWGHNPLPWPHGDESPGPACYCGRLGCLERWISGPAVAADHQRVTGHARSTPEIIAAADRGEAAALATRARFISRCARGLATVINLLDPDVIVLGGGLSNIPRIADDIAAQLPAWVFSDQVRTTLVGPRHGDASGVRGAAWLWPAS